MKKKILIAVMTVLMVMSLTACQDKDKQDNKQEDKQESTKVVTDVKGEVEIPAEPQRIVDLSGTSDILSILGYNVVGTANSDAYDQTKVPSYLESTLGDAKVLGYSYNDTMDTEAIFALNPDLVIISTVQEKMYDQLSSVVPTVMIQLEQLDWKEDFMNVASVFGKEEEATAWLNDYKERATKIGEEVREKCGEDTTYLAVLAGEEQFFVLSGAGFGNVMYEDLGLKQPANLPKQETVTLPVVTYEGLAEIDADFIFVIGTDAEITKIQENSIWKGLEPVKNNQYKTLPSSPYFNQGYSPIGRSVLLDEVQEILANANK